MSFDFSFIILVSFFNKYITVCSFYKNELATKYKFIKLRLTLFIYKINICI